MAYHIVYVTVGTTSFDSLISGVTSDEALEILKSRGCSKLILQLGTGTPVDGDSIRERFGIVVEQYDFKFEPIRMDIMNADLIIGHAGAGTCMDILNSRRRGLIVVNKELMNNHQVELAIELSSAGYIHCCDVTEIGERLSTLDLDSLKPYEKSDSGMKLFIDYLNKMMPC